MSDRIPLTDLKNKRNNELSKALQELASDSPTERSNLVTNGTNEGYSGDKLFSYDSGSDAGKSRKGSAVAPERAYMKDTTTNLQTLMNLMKGFVGTGILALPSAVADVGIVIGSLGLMLLAVITVHCMHLLVECSRTLCKRTGKVAFSFGDVAEESFRTYNPKTAVLGRLVVNIFLVLTQMGFCCVYFIFVAENLAQVTGVLDTRTWVAILLLPIMLFSFIRDLRWISPLSGIANVLILVGLIIILQYAARHIPSDGGAEAITDWFAGLPLFFGIAMFAFEGIAVVLPLENKMAQPEDFSMIINVGLGIITAFYALMGIVGYLFCGEDCKGSITLNLPNEPIYTAVKMIFAVDIFLTYNVQFYVPMQIIPPPILKHVPEKFQNVTEYGIRAVLVSCTCILAIVVPQLANFVSLVGSFASTALAVLFPTMFHMMLYQSAEEGAPRMSPLTLFKDAAIFMFGFLGFLFGTYSSVTQIILQFQYEATLGTAYANSNDTLGLLG